MRTILLGMLPIVAFLDVPVLHSQPVPARQRVRWFQQDKFGMFIHWGLYSILGEGEWIMKERQIPVAEYEKLTGQFNPTEFNAKDWVSLAKRAGMKYVVITTKHHDGFCMFDSKLTDYTISKATPFKRDIIAELSDECLKQGLKFGVYYSILDWHHPDYTPAPPWDQTNPARKNADFKRYMQYLEGQLRELCTNYSHVDLLWYDGGWDHKTDADKAEFARINAMVRELQPQILINDRANILEDFGTPEQFIPPTGLKNADGSPRTWEACLTMTTGHGSFPPTAWWGYDKNEKQFKSKEEVTRTLIDVVSRGGNLLLNVGPMPNGKIQKEFVENLEFAGDWLGKNGEAIYGTTASPFRYLGFWGRATAKGAMTYLFVYNWPDDGKLILPGWKDSIYEVRNNASLMHDRSHTFTAFVTPNEIKGVEPLKPVPKNQFDPLATMVVIDAKIPSKAEAYVNRPDYETGGIELPVLYGDLHGQHGQRATYAVHEGKAHVANWINVNDFMTWDVELRQPAVYDVLLNFACVNDAVSGSMTLTNGTHEFKFFVPKTGGATQFSEVRIGELQLEEGPQTVTLKATKIPVGQEVLRLRGLVLKPRK